MRLIGVVLGEETAKIRNSEASGLLDYGFSNKKVQSIKKETDVVDTVELEKATIDKIKVYPSQDINILQDKGISNKKYKISTSISTVKLPLKKNDVIGKITVSEKGKKVYIGDLIVKEDVEKLNFIQVLLRNMQGIVVGEI